MIKYIIVYTKYFLNLLIILKYQCLGIKAACDASFYNAITLHPIMALYDAFAAIALVFSTFILIPIAALINVMIMSGVWLFNRRTFQSTLQNIEEIYRQGAIKTKEEYQIYVDNLRQ